MYILIFSQSVKPEPRKVHACSTKTPRSLGIQKSARLIYFTCALLYDAAAGHGVLILFWLFRSIFGSKCFQRLKSSGPDLPNKLINPFIIFTSHRGLKIQIIRLQKETALTRTTIRHILLAWCTQVWRTRIHNQIRSVYGGWLTKLHLGEFSERKKHKEAFELPCVL